MFVFAVVYCGFYLIGSGCVLLLFVLCAVVPAVVLHFVIAVLLLRCLFFVFVLIGCCMVA